MVQVGGAHWDVVGVDVVGTFIIVHGDQLHPAEVVCKRSELVWLRSPKLPQNALLHRLTGKNVGVSVFGPVDWQVSSVM